MLNTPRGRPAAWIASVSRNAFTGATSLGLSTIVHLHGAGLHRQTYMEPAHRRQPRRVAVATAVDIAVAAGRGYPASSAAPSFAPIWLSGQFHGVIAPTTCAAGILPARCVCVRL